MTMSPVEHQMNEHQLKRLGRFRKAVEDRELGVIHMMLEEKAVTSVPADLGGQALLMAASAKYIATCEMLIRAGADVNARDGIGNTPVREAVEAQSPEILRMLLAAGANPNGTAVPGAAPILCAVTRDYLAGLEILIEAGASLDPAILDSRGGSLLHKAVELGSYDTVWRLIKSGVPINGRDDGGETALHIAARTRGKMAYALVRLGADVNAACELGRTPAMDAALAGSIEAFQLMIDSGADPLARDNRGLSAFDLALSAQRSAVAIYALQRYPALGPSGEALDKALATAVRGGCTPVVKRLVELGADIGQKPGGRTLLQIAPKDADALKRYLRALKTGAKIDQAMGGSDSSPASAPSFPAL